MKDSRATTLEHRQEQKPEKEKNAENRVLEKAQEGRVHHRRKKTVVRIDNCPKDIEEIKS